MWGGSYLFMRYAVPTILGEIKRHFRDTGWAAHVPRGMQERVMEVKGAMEELGSDAFAYGTMHTSRSKEGDQLITLRVDARVAHRFDCHRFITGHRAIVTPDFDMPIDVSPTRPSAGESTAFASAGIARGGSLKNCSTKSATTHSGSAASGRAATASPKTGAAGRPESRRTTPVTATTSPRANQPTLNA